MINPANLLQNRLTQMLRAIYYVGSYFLWPQHPLSLSNSKNYTMQSNQQIVFTPPAPERRGKDGLGVCCDCIQNFDDIELVKINLRSNIVIDY